MTNSEIQASYERFMARVAAILTPDELAVYRAYHRRLEERVSRPSRSSSQLSSRVGRVRARLARFGASPAGKLR